MQKRFAKIYSCIGLALLGNLLFSTGFVYAETQRSLKIYFIHTGEKEEVIYKRNGRYDPRGLRKINFLLRDWRRNEPTHMDPALLDLLWEAYRRSGSRAYIHVVSGYRSPETNSMLRGRSSGVARHSQHMLGKAIDFYFPDVHVRKLRNIGLKMEGGGVGYYPTAGSPFIHLDVGRVRHWPGIARSELIAMFPEGKTLHVPKDGAPLPGYQAAMASYRQRQNDIQPAVLAYGDRRKEKDMQKNGSGRGLFATFWSTKGSLGRQTVRPQVQIASLRHVEIETLDAEMHVGASLPSAAPLPLQMASLSSGETQDSSPDYEMQVEKLLNSLPSSRSSYQEASLSQSKTEKHALDDEKGVSLPDVVALSPELLLNSLPSGRSSYQEASLSQSKTEKHVLDDEEGVSLPDVVALSPELLRKPYVYDTPKTVQEEEQRVALELPQDNVPLPYSRTTLEEPVAVVSQKDSVLLSGNDIALSAIPIPHQRLDQQEDSALDEDDELPLPVFSFASEELKNPKQDLILKHFNSQTSEAKTNHKEISSEGTYALRFPLRDDVTNKAPLSSFSWGEGAPPTKKSSRLRSTLGHKTVRLFYQKSDFSMSGIVLDKNPISQVSIINPSGSLGYGSLFLPPMKIYTKGFQKTQDSKNIRSFKDKAVEFLSAIYFGA